MTWLFVEVISPSGKLFCAGAYYLMGTQRNVSMTELLPLNSNNIAFNDTERTLLEKKCVIARIECTPKLNKIGTWSY